MRYFLVDGGFSNWSDWSECSVTCANGQNTRTRSCDSPAPMRGGDLCEGEAVQLRDCTEIPCPGIQIRCFTGVSNIKSVS